jgi:hypothetical protein
VKRVRQRGRREVPNGQFVPIVANSYGVIGREGGAFLRMLDREAVELGRECARESLGPLVESLVLFLGSGVSGLCAGRFTCSTGPSSWCGVFICFFCFSSD